MVSKVSVLIKIVGSSCVYNYSFESFETWFVQENLSLQI